MDKFIGILFFHAVMFFDKKEKYDKEWNYIGEYVGEKSRRYLGFTMSRSEWEILKVSLKDFPEPDKEKLTDDHLYELISIFHKIFKMENIDYELRMYGSDNEREILEGVFDDFSKYLDIIGSSNGVHLTLGRWLSNPKYDRALIEREINLSELI